MKTPKKTHHTRYGEGSFYYDTKNNVWIGQFDAGYTPSGARRRIKVSSKNEDTAWKKFQEKRRQALIGELTTVKADKMTVKQFAEEWLKHRKTKVRPKTYSAHASYIKKWIIPTLGHRTLSTLGARDVRELGTAIMNAGKSSTTAQCVQRIFQQICKDAKAEGYKVPDPVLLAEKKTNAVSDRRAIPVKDAIKLLKVASTLPDGSRWVAALLQGMRQGECLGLTWEQVDFVEETITISWQLQRIPYDKENGGFAIPDGYESRHLHGAVHLVRPKSRRGYRVIPMIPAMKAVLEEWREVSPRSEYGLVWPDEQGKARRLVCEDRAWKELQDLAGIDPPNANRKYYVLHEARNTTATLLLVAGVDSEVIKQILGHSSIVTSREYMTVGNELKRDALRQVGELLEIGF